MDHYFLELTFAFKAYFSCDHLHTTLMTECSVTASFMFGGSADTHLVTDNGVCVAAQ